jgi:hypothetical protein
VLNALLLLLIGFVLWRLKSTRNNAPSITVAPKTEPKVEKVKKVQEHKGDAKELFVEDDEVVTEEELVSRNRTAKLLAQRLDKAKELWDRMEKLANAPKTKLRDSHQTLRRLYDSWYSETSFLDRIKAPFTPNTFCQLHSSNLIHIEAVLSVLEHPNVSDICDVHSRIRFLFPSSSSSSSSSSSPSSAIASPDGSDSEALSSEHESSDPETREGDESYEDEEDDDEMQQQDESKTRSVKTARQLGEICRETQNAIQQNPLIEQVRKRRVSRKVMKESQIKRHQLIVDVVCKAGTCWICIIARNPAQLVWEASDDNSRRGLRQKIEKICRGASNQMQV